MGFLFTSESVSEGHPDKVSDQISDAILDEFLRHDPYSKVACETLCTTGLVVVAGEVRSEAYVDVQDVARRVINRIGYTQSGSRSGNRRGAGCRRSGHHVRLCLLGDQGADAGDAYSLTSHPEGVGCDPS